MKAPQSTVGCRRRTRFTYQGSNTFVEKKTKKKKRSSEPLADPAKCKHEATDRRGSSKTTTHVYCKMCGTVVDEMLREEAQERGRGQERGKHEVACEFDTASMIEHEVNNSCMGAEAALEVFELFKTDSATEIEHDEPIRIGVMFGILANAVEAVVRQRRALWMMVS